MLASWRFSSRNIRQISTSVRLSSPKQTTLTQHHRRPDTGGHSRRIAETRNQETLSRIKLKSSVVDGLFQNQCAYSLGAHYFGSKPDSGDQGPSGGSGDSAAASGGGDSAAASGGANDDGSGSSDEGGMVYGPPEGEEFPATSSLALTPLTVPDHFPNVPVVAVKRNPVFPRFIKMIEVHIIKQSRLH